MGFGIRFSSVKIRKQDFHDAQWVKSKKVCYIWNELKKTKIEPKFSLLALSV
jgi:hypothetical protein